jgi:hypothetical protein
VNSERQLPSLPRATNVPDGEFASAPQFGDRARSGDVQWPCENCSERAYSHSEASETENFGRPDEFFLDLGLEPDERVIRIFVAAIRPWIDQITPWLAAASLGGCLGKTR